MIQYHQIWESKPQPIEISFKNSHNDQNVQPYILLSTPSIKLISEGKEMNTDKQPVQIQTVFSYLKRSKEMTKDVLGGTFISLYPIDEEKQFSKAYLHQVQKCVKLGCKLARTMQGQENGVIILQNEITYEDINSILYGFTLANFRWHIKTSMESDGPKGLHQPIRSIVMIHTSITQQGLQEYVEKDWNQKLINKLPNNIVGLRYLASQRPNVATTSYMLNHIKKIQESLGDCVKLTTIVGDKLLEQKLNLIHAVGRASIFPPALATLVYKGAQDQDAAYLALIGKGVVFDSGGLSIKSNAGMECMFSDKTGACTVLEAFRAIVELKIPLNVVCTVAIVENSIGENAFRVSDIIQSYKGLTVEILNTDAEGRLILADAMSYTQHNFKVDVMIELSTLTGAVKSAIGSEQAGLFTNCKLLAKSMRKLSKLTNEEFCKLPLTDEHRGNVKGTYGDIKNSTSAGGGASNAAAFLEFFVEKGVKWMHWDIAAVDLVSSDKSIYNRGSTGFGLQQIVYFAANKAELLGDLSQKKKSEKNGQIMEQKI